MSMKFWARLRTLWLRSEVEDVEMLDLKDVDKGHSQVGVLEVCEGIGPEDSAEMAKVEGLWLEAVTPG